MQAQLRNRCGHRLCTVIPAKAGIQYSAATLGLLGRRLSRAMTRLCDAMRPKSALSARFRRQCAPHRICREVRNDAACRRRGAACRGEL